LDIYDLIVAHMHSAIFNYSGLDCHMSKGLVGQFLYSYNKINKMH